MVYEQIKLKRDGKPALRFRGELLAEVRSIPDSAAGGAYSGEPGRWLELALYRTSGGNYVCQRVGRTRWVGEHDRFEAQLCRSPDEVFQFFGYGWLSQDLYQAVGLEPVEDVE